MPPRNAPRKASNGPSKCFELLLEVPRMPRRNALKFLECPPLPPSQCPLEIQENRLSTRRVPGKSGSPKILKATTVEMHLSKCFLEMPSRNAHLEMPHRNAPSKIQENRLSTRRGPGKSGNSNILKSRHLVGNSGQSGNLDIWEIPKNRKIRTSGNSG